MKFIRLAIAALALAIAPGLAWAQAWPAKPVKIVVPFAAGSSTDILARLVADHFGKVFGQPFVVENKAGAGGIIGTELTARAPADGYTLIMLTSGPFASNPAVYAKLPYDPVKDFDPIANIGFTPQVFVVGPQTKFRTLKELVEAAKKDPGGIGAGSLGKGATSHLALEAFQGAAGIKLNHIPFKGSSEAQTQVIGGSVPMMSDAVPGVRAQIQGGKLKGLAIASLKRSPFLPDVPTFAEQGYTGFEAVGWIGLGAPAGTPPAILDRMNAEIVKMLDEPAVKQKFDSLAFVSAIGSRAEFAAFIKAEIAKWSKVAKDAGVRAD